MMPRYTWPRTAHCDGGGLMAAAALAVAAVALAAKEARNRA